LKHSEIQPISPVEFRAKIKTSKTLAKIDYELYFQAYIEKAADYAIGPYYWFIPDNSGPKTVAASSSFNQLTPYSVQQLIEKSVSPQFFAENIYIADREYVLSAIEMAMRISENRFLGKSKVPKFNIYCRMINAQNLFVWRLIQFPAIYFNEAGQAEAVFVLVTDLSHLAQITSPMMTMIDESNQENQYFSVSVATKILNPLQLPKITVREQQILRLMAKGMNNPLIAKELNIAVNTVQNHKRNLREKTSTKTAAELISYVLTKHLL
jgi:DNA-binding CsgD family transcriptional regulator